jgi:hypothetical protein
MKSNKNQTQTLVIKIQSDKTIIYSLRLKKKKIQDDIKKHKNSSMEFKWIL